MQQESLWSNRLLIFSNAIKPLSALSTVYEYSFKLNSRAYKLKKLSSIINIFGHEQFFIFECIVIFFKTMFFALLFRIWWSNDYLVKFVWVSSEMISILFRFFLSKWPLSFFLLGELTGDYSSLDNMFSFFLINKSICAGLVISPKTSFEKLLKTLLLSLNLFALSSFNFVGENAYLYFNI